MDTFDNNASVLFVGLGAMGSPMSTLLAQAGYKLTIHDVDAKRCEELASTLGATACIDLSKVGDDFDVAILMLPSSPIVELVLGGPEAGLFSQLNAGTVLIDMGSSEPGRTVALGEVAEKLGIIMADAPVSGGTPRAITGQLAIMFGGEEALMERCRPIMDVLGSSLTLTGGIGTGHAMKALNNLLAGLSIIGAAEILCIGKSFGLKPDVMIEVLNNSTGRNQATEVKYPNNILTRKFDAGFSLQLMMKDMTTAMALARQLKASAPVSAACYEAFLGAEHMLDDLKADVTEVVKYVERNIGSELV